jgi:3-dehydroquinate dehydratase-2
MPEEAMAKYILCVNGPNLNLLGSREPHRYGTASLQSIESRLTELAAKAGANVSCFQSNCEADLVERIQQAPTEGIDFILINPAAYTHTSIAIRDALAAVSIPFIEIHLTNIHAREPFRQRSYFSDLAVGVVSGLGAQGYELALTYALEQARKD